MSDTRSAAAAPRGHIDERAVSALLAETIDWRFKGLPDAMRGHSIAAARDLRLNLFRDGFLPPLVVLDDAALEHNITVMADWCASRGLAHAPHGKTTMAPQLFARQFAAGVWGQTAANASQLRVYRAFGVSPVLLANQLVDPAALRWLAAELDGDPDFDFTCWVDSTDGVRMMTEALTAAGARRRVDVLVERGAPGARTGVRSRAAAIEVAEAVTASPRLRLTGVGGYEGALAGDTSPEALDTVRHYLAGLRDLAIDLADRGLLDGLDRVIVTAGGSAYFDLVTDMLSAPWPAGLPVLPVLRSGAYLTHDDGHYRELSPLGHRPRTDSAPALRSALLGWAQVTSRPEPNLALLTAGKRDLPYDIDLPVPLRRRSGGTAAELSGCTVPKMNDQHTFVRLAGDTDLDVGDWVGLGLSHPCTTFDKWGLIPVVDGDSETVIDLVRTFF